MLVELRSPAFIEKGEERPPIRFQEGLHVILGKEDGENSIGKSSAMLAIDFAFGGSAYVSGDGVKHIGHHTVFFAFCFDGRPHYFARATSEPEYIHLCNSDYMLTGAKWTKEEFVNWLKECYHIDFLGLSFRTTLSSFFRIYGKDNYDERKPLRGIPGQNMQKSIEMLVKLFDRFKDIEQLNSSLDETKKKLEAYREARKYRFVSDLVGGQQQYEDNAVKIKNLELQLDTLTLAQNEEHTEVDIEKSRAKEQLMGAKLRAETEVQSLQRRLKLLNMNLEYGLYPTEADLQALQEYFPGVNLSKLYEVEKYHQKLARILDQQFSDEKEAVETEIGLLQATLRDIQTQIADLGYVGNISKEFLDKHAEIKGHIDALKTQNEAYVLLVDLQAAKKRADDLLKKGIEDILADIQTELNDKMKEFNDSLFDETRKAPHLTFNEYNSYHFETPDDTGTGSNFKGMVIYDLAVLFTTALPAIAHDSLILKNISDGVIDGIMKIYATSKKQIFIAFDKQAAYKPATQRILAEHTVLKLSDHNCELYGQSWSKEKNNEERQPHENEL